MRQDLTLVFCICDQRVDVTGANRNTCLENSLEISHIQRIKGEFIAGFSYMERKSTSQPSGQVCLPRKAGFSTLKQYRPPTENFILGLFLGVGQRYYPCP